MTDFTTENFMANLKLAASYYPSISEMCRKLQINRQQFMKYLSGSSFPSRYNLRRICDFFGFDEYEILLPHDQFKNLVRLRPVHGGEDILMPPGLSDMLSQAQRNRGMLSRTQGYYHQYYLSFSHPNHILKSLVYIYGWNDYTLYKRLERLKYDGKVGPPDVFKYAGLATVVGDRMHMLDQETLTGSELTQTVLFMNYRNRVSMLTGLNMGVSGRDTHEPSSSRVVMEYIGRSVNLRQAISDCRLYAMESESVPERIRSHLTAAGRIGGPLRGATF
ncbi:helix-turn-helix domain-containing protein [Tropicimonas aquimaris]|uniref:Helix-turn-helix transcriptional regulator n=1 Tax=Tropicimonas aquimaris TaxID=914152 RepID=A0ABW3IQN0_9RHOB